MSFDNEIGRYSLWYYGKLSDDSRGIAFIRLYNNDRTSIGRVYFYKDSQELPDNFANESTTPKRAYLRMHVSQMDKIVDMLRNEKPCRVVYYSPTLAYIYTGKEPVGEEETDEE